MVSTDVGGLPEVLPEDMIAFAKPDPEQLAEVLCASVSRAQRVDRR